MLTEEQVKAVSEALLKEERAALVAKAAGISRLSVQVSRIAIAILVGLPSGFVLWWFYWLATKR